MEVPGCSVPAPETLPQQGLGFLLPHRLVPSEGPALVLQRLPAFLSSQPRRSWGAGGIPFGAGEKAPMVGDVSDQLTSSLSACRSVSLSFYYLLTPGDGDGVTGRSCTLPPPPNMEMENMYSSPGSGNKRERWVKR